MKKKIQIAILALLTIGGTVSVEAGNPQRAGQSGAMELLINPWSRSSGFGGLNSASVRGIEASFLNVAGTAFTEGTEVVFSHTNWFGDADISINAAGLTQRVGENGVLGV